MQLEEHYKQLLALGEGWKVVRVYLNTKGKQVDIWVEHTGGREKCPSCKAAVPFYDRSPERKWRHLDTMAFQTFIHASPVRVQCKLCGVSTVEVPWAGKHGRFTLAFETFAIAVIEACSGTSKAARLLGMDGKQVRDIMARAVRRGLARRQKKDEETGEERAWLGIDEKSFLRGQSYVSVLTDHEEGCVLEVAEGRTTEDAQCLITNALSERQREMVCAVAMDMSAAYEAAVRKELPDADIVHDKFHLTKSTTEMVDATRRQEHGRLRKAGEEEVLTGTRFSWLRSYKNMEEEEREGFDELRSRSLDTAKAWQVKEIFDSIWGSRDKESARRFFWRWHAEAIATGLSTVKKVAASFASHLENILTYFDSFITNGPSEGLNSKIQTIKSCARGFRSFENYRISILFHCGSLSLYP